MWEELNPRFRGDDTTLALFSLRPLRALREPIFVRVPA